MTTAVSFILIQRQLWREYRTRINIIKSNGWQITKVTASPNNWVIRYIRDGEEFQSEAWIDRQVDHSR